MTEPVRRIKAHGKGVTFACFSPQRHIVTCGADEDVHLYSDLKGVAEDDVQEFSVSTSAVSALACYLNADGSDVIALGMDDNTVQAFSTEGTSEGLLMRFTAPVTCLAVSSDHAHLGAGSSDFTMKVLDLSSLPAFTSYSLTGHEAPVLAIQFDPRGEFLASTSCDGTMRVWSLSGRSIVKSLPILPKSNDYALSSSLGWLSWKKDGQLLAVPTGCEVKVYTRDSWTCLHTLSDSYHKEVLNVVSWCPRGDCLACADVSGRVSVWQATKRKLLKKMQNENGISITALEWDPGMESDTSSMVFADKDGHIGLFEVALPKEEMEEKDPLIEDSLLMEGIPADDIFGDDYDDPFMDSPRSNSEVGVASNAPEEGGDDACSLLSEGSGKDEITPDQNRHAATKGTSGIKFSDKMIEVYQSPWQPSATPAHLHHRFMVYNLVGVVRCHDDDDASLVEVDFHDSGTHHSFSLPNSLEHTMATLNSHALVLACRSTEDKPSQLQCVHFGSWDSTKDWVLPMPKKESVEAVAMGDGWIAVATNKHFLRLLSVGGVQKEVLSLPGQPVTLAGWGPRLAVVYETPPCTQGVYSLTVWLIDVQRRRQLHPPHTLPLTQHSQLRWIGFSEEGCLITHDSKGIVRIHSNSNYGGSSWIPVLDTTKQSNNKSDTYFLVGMTHDPDELRAILCKGMEYPPVQPRPVMSSLPLSMPLCEPELEKTEHERGYLQEVLVFPPSQPHPTADLVQKLMKMFALACKSGREFRAWEIAAMLPDNNSAELALTYASRTHRIRLARQINEFMQQRAAAAEDSDEEEEEEEGEELVEEETWAHTNGYKDRREGSRHGRLGPLSNGSVARTFAPLKMSSKTSEIRNTRKPVLHTATTNQVDETAELFSDNEEENKDTEANGEIESDSDGETKHREEEEEESIGSGRSPSIDDSCLKRPNPFKLATPVSKKISVDRQQGFLRKISARVDEEKKSMEAKKQQKDKGGLFGKSTGKKTKSRGSGKSKNNTIPQKTLMGSFFKSKQTAPSVENGGGESQQPVEEEEQEMMTPPLDSQESCDSNNDSNSGGSKLTSSQKLASFAFKTA